MYSTLSEAENSILRHVGMWGSDAYPIQKVSGSKWLWADMFGIKGAPIVFKTKTEAVAAFEAYMDTLRERVGEEVKARISA